MSTEKKTDTKGKKKRKTSCQKKKRLDRWAQFNYIWFNNYHI